MKLLKKAQDKLVAAGIQVPGYAQQDRTFWLFPIVVPDVAVAYDALVNIGVDPYLGATQLRVIQPPTGSKYEELAETQEYFDRV